MDEIPIWAIELIKQVERLNEKLPTHIDWVERNIKDHEMRIRNLERRMWVIAGASGVTVNGTPGLKLRTQWSVASLVKRGTDSWVLFGDVTN